MSDPVGNAGPGLRITVGDAETLARRLLGGASERWRHTRGVARRAWQIAGTVEPADRPLLLAAVWLHDIGYGDELHDTGFPPLDGARYLDRLGWPHRLSGLVAHHSGAAFVAETIGLADVLAAYPREVTPVADALTYADQTVGPDGRPFTVEAGVEEVLSRHGPDSPQVRAEPLRRRDLQMVAARVRRRLIWPAAGSSHPGNPDTVGVLSSDPRGSRHRPGPDVRAM